MSRARCPSTRTSSGATRSPKPSYDVVIVGGGGHGLATAYYLAKNHGITNIAVLEKGWLAGGNMARNTTIIRSNYLWDESAAIYEHSLKLWESLPEELDYDFLFSQRGVMNLAHTLRRRAREQSAGSSANQLNGVDAEWLDPRAGQGTLPDPQHQRQHPLPGAWAPPTSRAPASPSTTTSPGRFARKCRRAGRRPHPELRGHRLRQGRRPGRRRRDHPRHASPPARSALVRGRAQLACWPSMAGFRLPIQSHPLQALVSELHEPVHPTVVMSNHVHVYVSPGAQGRAGHGRRRRLLQRLRPARLVPRHRAPDGGRRRAVPDLRPGPRAADLGRHRGRHPGRLADRRAAPRSTNMFVNCGWGTGGFKATPGAGWTFAHTIATGEPHPLNAPFALERFDNRRPDRRARRRRRGPLSAPEDAHAADRLPLLRAARRDRVPLRRPGPRRLPGGPARARPTRNGPSTCSTATTPRAPSPSAGCTRAGCRQWFNVVRDTVTYDIQAVYRWASLPARPQSPHPPRDHHRTPPRTSTSITA